MWLNVLLLFVQIMLLQLFLYLFEYHITTSSLPKTNRPKSFGLFPQKVTFSKLLQLLTAPSSTFVTVIGNFIRYMFLFSQKVFFAIVLTPVFTITSIPCIAAG